jgi:hypothetical protein
MEAENVYMKVYLLVFFTLTAVLGHSPVALARALSCEGLFKGPPQVSVSIEEPLTALRNSLDELNAALKNPALALEGDLLSPLKELSEDPRELSYLLQGSYRLLISHPQAVNILSEKQLRKLQDGLDQMKWLEKKLGQYQNSKDLAKAGRKIGAPADFVSYLESQRNINANIVIEKLRKREFLSDEISTVQALIEELQGMKKLNSRISENYLPESLQTEIQRVQEKVSLEMKPLMLQKNYGYHELEDGAHAFRRSLRWLKVYIMAYRDHFSLAEKVGPPTASEKILRDKYLSKEEALLSPDGAIKLRESEYYLLIEMVAELRKIKGAGEIRENLTNALTAFGRWNGEPVDAVKATELVAVRTEAKLQDVEIRTQEILQRYELHNGFQNMIIRKQP